jgi:hypothetical protein
LPIIAQHGNKVAAQTVDVTNPKELVNVLSYANFKNLINKPIMPLKEFGAKMNEIYVEAIG